MLAAAYQTLGVAADAEPEVVDAAYRALMKKYHPDRWPRPSAEAKQRAQEINAAYAAIKSGGAGPTPEPVWQSEPVFEHVALTPPLRMGRRMAWTVTAWIAILAAMAAVATSR